MPTPKFGRRRFQIWQSISQMPIPNYQNADSEKERPLGNCTKWLMAIVTQNVERSGKQREDLLRVKIKSQIASLAIAFPKNQQNRLSWQYLRKIAIPN